MMNPLEIERSYQEFMRDLKSFLPDGMIEVDFSLLQDLGLTEEKTTALEEEEGFLTESFYVVESGEKLTLFNHKYLIWIVPKFVDQIPMTYTLVALNSSDKVHLEMVFTTAGIYNQSALVLRILEKFLSQIEENEAEICFFKGDDLDLEGEGTHGK